MTRHELPSITRRTFGQCLALGALLPRVAMSAGATQSDLFGLSDVRVIDGPFAHAQSLNRKYVLAHDVDRLLAGFRTEAGLEARAAKYPNWESMGLDGHTAGHYLSALAQGAACGDQEMRLRLDYMVSELQRCQQANGNGYVGAVPNGRTIWKAIAEGQINAPGFSLNGAWVPLYNVHKTLAGLRDAYLVGRNAAARGVLIQLADWCGSLIAGLDDAQVQIVLNTEHGGINEVLADVFAITGEPRYLTLAKRFSHRAILDPLLRREDALDGLHANTQIPKVIGFARIGELSGDRSWCDAAAFFWDTVTKNRCVAFGGNSVREHFNPSGSFSSMIESREGPETCNTYNMLRLTELLYRLDPQARYADFYERALFNHILSSQHPEHGGFVYFTPIRPRHYRVYSQPGECFWCCVGTGMENHGKYGAFVYAHDERSVSVNLFIQSEVRWGERGVVLRQETKFPDADSTLLTLQLDRPKRFALNLRHPAWIEGPLRVELNGEPIEVRSQPSSYATIERRWKSGDQLSISLPMRTHVERLPDGSDYVAVLHGPIVLAAKTGTEEMTGLIADDGRGSHIAPGAYLPLERAPMLVADADALEKQIVPVAQRTLVFNASHLVRPEGFRQLELAPLFRTHDARYMVYWRTTTPAMYPAVVREIEASEAQRMALEARTLDQIAVGEQQPEVDHQFNGEETKSGVLLARRWRDTARWMTYRLKANKKVPAAEIMLTFYGGHRHDGFKLLIDDKEIATIRLTGAQPDKFIEMTYPLSADIASIAATAGVAVKLLTEGERTSPLFEIRLLSK